MIVRYGTTKIVQASLSLSGLWPSTHRLLKTAGKKLASLDLDPEKHLYLRNRAVSALELHGPNQNWDAFEYPELDKKYSTFIGNDISVDHIGTQVVGTVLDSEFIKVSDFREEMGIPMLPVNDTIQVLSEKCSQDTVYGHVLDYANAQKLVRGSDRTQILNSVGQHLCTGGWVENVWAIDKEVAEAHTPGMCKAILSGDITDSSMGALVNESVCSVCNNIATGELPEHEDFCDCILNWKGQQMNYEGMIVVPFEINRDISFFEDSLILPHQFGGQAGGEGADKDAKFLESFASKKRSSVVVSNNIFARVKVASKKKTADDTGEMSMNSNPDSNVQENSGANSGVYEMIGDVPDIVRENKEEFKKQRREFADEEQDKDITPNDYPEGTIITFMYEGVLTDASVVEETEDGLVVAIENLDEPIEIDFDEVTIDVKKNPEDISYTKELEMQDIAQPEMHPESRSAGFDKKLRLGN